MLIRTNRVYSWTEAGANAVRSESSVPSWFRATLNAISGETHFDAICQKVGSAPRKQVLEWLDQLETLGFVRLVSFTLSSPSPDTTGAFSFHSLPRPSSRQ